MYKFSAAFEKKVLILFLLLNDMKRKTLVVRSIITLMCCRKLVTLYLNVIKNVFLFMSKCLSSHAV